MRDAPHRGIPAPSCRFPLFCAYATHPTRTGVTKAVSAPLPEVPRARQHPTACGETVNSIETSRRPIIHIRRQSGSPSQVVQNWFLKSKAGRRPKSPETNYIETHSQITVGISRSHHQSVTPNPQNFIERVEALWNQEPAGATIGKLNEDH